MPTSRSPLACWRPRPSKRPAVFNPTDGSWRSIVPSFAGCLRMAGSGIPFQIVLNRTYDRSAQPKRLAPALKAGATVYLPQVHQVLPRLARLMAALEAELLGLRSDATSYLFLVEGKGREGMGLHHDGEL